MKPLAGAVVTLALIWSCWRAGDWLGGAFLEREANRAYRIELFDSLSSRRERSRRSNLFAPNTTASANAVSASPANTRAEFAPDDSPFVRAELKTEPRASRELSHALEKWQRTHAGPVAPYLQLYAPNVKIVDQTGRVMSRAELGTLAQSVRSGKTFDRVSSLSAPRIVVQGEWGETRVRHRYGNSGGGAWVGDRRLVWKRTAQGWRVIEDWFPPDLSSAL